jgi:hypothetical protein
MSIQSQLNSCSSHFEQLTSAAIVDVGDGVTATGAGAVVVEIRTTVVAEGVAAGCVCLDEGSV